MEFENDSSLSSSCQLSPGNPAPALLQAPPNTSLKRRAGRKKFNETRHPVYRGVRRRNGDKWVCEVREPNKKSRIWLGTFPCPEMAARAHDVAALALRGELAQLNFHDSAWLLPRPDSSSPRDIQKAALEAAEAFRPAMSMSSTNSSLEPPTLFKDEEELFNMPGLLDSMAEGLMVTPLGMQRGLDWDSVDCSTDFTLWMD
ncbi:dehydration-responsive element-binding protein 1B-like [Tripterygium wilfordii]|uniref:Dehydration-responsive element-binding protein 1B-like n=1 Tax=Tripterygium wilfordii TaxID=458696 RepID=A0A7J7DEN6_TRIWF|nr:dehydration-responsive element-binding protein 1F-like [Tripterygium wilfordii]KAF5744820.1 dehydration-responsive element-binding protein 1B-like [Tripterygium wilfordii]